MVVAHNLIAMNAQRQLNIVNNKKVKLIDNAFRRFECDYAADNSEALQNHNLGPASMNDSQLSSILKAYPIVKERLLSEV